MEGATALFVLFFFNIHLSTPSFVFHENTGVVFTSNLKDSFFGYSTILRSDGLYVGAPRTLTGKTIRYGKGKTMEKSGLIFNCSLGNLNTKQVYCQPAVSSNVVKKGGFYLGSALQNNSWFGASMAFLTKDSLLVSAPRFTSAKPHRNFENLLQGAGYILTPRRSVMLKPLEDDHRQGFVIEDTKHMYSDSTPRVFLYYYAHGEAGFSMTVTNNNTVILGAPGIMQLKGAVVSYVFNPNNTLDSRVKPIIANPYYTNELEDDSYFGYSVGFGIFEDNGTELFVAGAPRAKLGKGKVLIFTPPTTENQPLDIKFELIGQYVGSYFGASICCTDINQDGLDDLLVGAPTFVKNDGTLIYDQGAVFIYMTKMLPEGGFVIEESGYVLGSEVDEARFGTAIADLGDIDGDDFRDIAIGAPFENGGTGAIYIYKGNAKGLNKQYAQRIQPAGGQGFGWSIAKGADIDNNYCNDLAIGAYKSGTSYLYRCIPTMTVHALIKIDHLTRKIISLSDNAKTFSAKFCVLATAIKFKPEVEINFIANVYVDPEYSRATIIGNSKYKLTVKPNDYKCDELNIDVNETANLLQPMNITFKLEADELLKADSETFLMNAARLDVENSNLSSTILVQVTKDCGNDLVCSPSFYMIMEALDNPYVPGTNKSLGFKLTVRNEEEPAYGVTVNISLPMPPMRIPGECKEKDLIMLCELPQPFVRNQSLEWEIEMEFNLRVTETKDLKVIATLIDEFHRDNIGENLRELEIEIKPEALVVISGKSMPNDSMTISRDDLSAGVNVSFTHKLQITNFGPSNWDIMIAHLYIPELTYLATEIEGCEETQSYLYECLWSVPAKVSMPVSVSLQMNLNHNGDFLKENITYNATTLLILLNGFRQGSQNSFEVTTTLILEPFNYFWYIVGFGILMGLLVLALIVWIMYKCGFFNRRDYEKISNEGSPPEASNNLDDSSQSDEGDNENKDNKEIVLSVANKTTSYHKNAAYVDSEDSTTVVCQ